MISKGDRISMHSSVETRYPFLDDDVIKFCSQIDPTYKLHGKVEKWILRKVAAKTLPTQIANRPKTMFRASLSQTFLGKHRPSWVDQLLSPESLKATGYFDPKAVAWQRMLQNTIPRITTGRFIYDVGLTCVVSTQLWHHIYCGGGLCDLPTYSPPAISNE
jgi:asparagine synthase (glutamine-hydrolysing)